MTRAPINERPFVCATCRTRYQVGTTRITGKNCASCALAAGFIASRAQPRKPDPRVCVNCAREIGHRRAVPRDDGQVVHYRCPTTTRAERRARSP